MKYEVNKLYLLSVRINEQKKLLMLVYFRSDIFKAYNDSIRELISILDYCKWKIQIYDIIILFIGNHYYWRNETIMNCIVSAHITR